MDVWEYWLLLDVAWLSVQPDTNEVEEMSRCGDVIEASVHIWNIILKSQQHNRCINSHRSRVAFHFSPTLHWSFLLLIIQHSHILACRSCMSLSNNNNNRIWSERNNLAQYYSFLPFTAFSYGMSSLFGVLHSRLQGMVEFACLNQQITTCFPILSLPLNFADWGIPCKVLIDNCFAAQRGMQEKDQGIRIRTAL